MSGSEAIYYLHRNQLTLIARHVCGVCRREVSTDFYRANGMRLSRLRATTQEVISELERARSRDGPAEGLCARQRSTFPIPMRACITISICIVPRPREQGARILRHIGYATDCRRRNPMKPDTWPHLRSRPSWKWRDDFFDLDTPGPCGVA